MTVGELKLELSKFPDDATVHVDLEYEGDGDRVVRVACAVRKQAGYNAVAIDGATLELSHELGYGAEENQE